MRGAPAAEAQSVRQQPDLSISALGEQLLYFIVATEVAAVLLVPPLIVAYRRFGSRGLWGTAAAVWSSLGGVAIWRYLRVEGADLVVLVVVPILLVSWALVPAHLIDRATRRHANPSVWTQYLYGIVGYNIASLGLMSLVFVGAVVIAVVQLAR